MSAPQSAASTPNAEVTQNASPVTSKKPAGPIGALLTMVSFVGRMRWPIFCLFQLGVIGGFVAMWVQSIPIVAAPDRRSEAQRISEPSHAAVTHASEQFPLSDLERGDQLMRDGRFERALAAYQTASVSSDHEVPALLRYRIALCLESLGRWDAANAEFSSVRMAAASPVYEIAAQLGQIRIWMRKGQNSEAKSLLCDLLLRSGSKGFHDGPFLAETVHRLARLMTEEVIGGERPSPLNSYAVAQTAEDSRLEYVLEWLEIVSTPDDAHAVPVEATLEVETASGSAEQAMVHGSLNRTSVLEALQQLTGACGRQCLLTPQAQRELSDRTIALSISSLPLPTVLTGITEPLGILWEVTDEAVHFCRDVEVTREALATYRFRYAERALLDAIERYPAQRLCDSANFELGNLACFRGKYQEAAERYERLSLRLPRSTVTVEASYNLGLALRRLGRSDSAREAFYRVIDGAPNNALASLASLTIGRMYLDQAEFERAIPPLRRAAAFGVGTDVVPVAALLLTSTHLLMKNADAANAILTEYRDLLTEPRYRNITAFLGSYARMLGSGGGRQAQRESRVLSWAIVGASRESVLGPAGVLLMGQAYRELGLGEKMVELYQKALQEGVPPALEPEMSFDMAEQSLIAGDLRAAIHGFTGLASRGSGKWNRLAQLRLAQIALDDGRVEDCLQSCRSLLEPRDAPDMAAVLKLLGRAFE